MKIKIRPGILALTFFILFILLVSPAQLISGSFLSAHLQTHPVAFAQGENPSASEPVILTDEQGSYPLGLYLDLLEDPSGELTIDDITSPEYESQFVRSQTAVPNYGFTNSVYWVRLRLENQNSQTDEWLLEQGFANTQYVDLYTPLPDGEGFAVKQTGMLRPASTRDIPHPRIIFNLTIPPHSQQTYYLRFQSGASMTLPLTLWAQTTFLNQSLIERTLAGIFYGVLIGLLFYNLFLLFSLREADYLYFAILLGSLIIEEISYDGYLALLTPTSLNFLTKFYEPLSFPLLIASLILFADSFLQLRDREPKFHRLNLFILAVWGVLVLLVPFTRYLILARLMAPWSLISVLVVLWAGFVSWRRGFRPVRYFMLAWLGMLISLLWIVLVRLGIVPSTTLSENAFRFGYVWMVICWSIALADRINLLKEETENANLALKQSKHKLSEILEGLPLGVVVYGKDHKPNYVNQRAIEILRDPDRGILPDLSAGRSLSEAINYFSLKVTGTDEIYPLTNLPVSSALQGQPALADDVEIDQGDTKVQLEIIANPVRDDAGNVESAVVAFQDISLRKQMEQELRNSETRFRVIAENNFDGIAFMDRDRKVLYVSPSYLRLVGKTAEELLGQSGVGLVHPDDRDYTAKKFNEALQQPNTRIIAEYRIPHESGSWIWVETYAINMLDNPYVQAIVLNSHDITDRKQTEAELAEYRKHLESLVNVRTAELSTVNEQLQMRLDWLSAINLVNQIMARSVPAVQIYQKIIEIISDLFAAQGSFIAELDEGGKQWKILAHFCRSKLTDNYLNTFMVLPESIFSDPGLVEHTLVYLSKDELSSMNDPYGIHLQNSQIQGITLVPLVLREKLFGVLGLEMYADGSTFTSEESDLLGIFSTDIAQLIEDTHLYEQSKALIAAEERNRLARDLHDSVTQVLFSATLLADVLPKIWSRDPEKGLERLDKLRQLTRGALAEMRTLLLELRPAAVINTPLGDLLAQLTEAITSRSGIPFQLYLEPTLPLPEDVHTSFYRIAQEALNNVSKHSQAKLVTVSLNTSALVVNSADLIGQEVKLEILDDGVGFSLAKEGSGRLGMSIMRERAAAIQASLSVESQLGYGTKVTLSWAQINGSYHD